VVEIYRVLGLYGKLLCHEFGEESSGHVTLYDNSMDTRLLWSFKSVRILHLAQQMAADV
jgi:ubiquinone/menaquinone biosynthesis C-methylase UbiE